MTCTYTDIAIDEFNAATATAWHLGSAHTELGESLSFRALDARKIKSRMNALRWWAARVNRSNVIARSNDFDGIPNRTFVSQTSRACEAGAGQLVQIREVHVVMSLQLLRAFGLRREEAMEINPSYADRGDHLYLKRSWTKEG